MGYGCSGALVVGIHEIRVESTGEGSSRNKRMRRRRGSIQDKFGGARLKVVSMALHKKAD